MKTLLGRPDRKLFILSAQPEEVNIGSGRGGGKVKLLLFSFFVSLTTEEESESWI